MGDLICDLLEELLSGLLESSKVPKAIRYILSTVLYIVLIFFFAFIAIIGDTAGIRVFFGVLAVLFLIFYVHSIKKIHRS